MSQGVLSPESAPLRSVEFTTVRGQLFYFEHCKPFEVDYHPEEEVPSHNFSWAEAKGKIIMEQVYLRFGYKGFIIVGETLPPLYEDLRTKKHVIIRQAEKDQPSPDNTPHVVDFCFFRYRD